MLRTALPLLALALLATPALATDLQLTHGGYLLDAADHAVDATKAMTFRLYDAPTGGNLLWTGHDGGSPCQVPVRAGYYAVVLGGAGPGACGTGLTTAEWSAGATTYLEVVLDTNLALLPRVPVVPQPIATLASDALALGGVAADTLVDGVTGKLKLAALPAGAAHEVLRMPASGSTPAFGALDLSQPAAVTGTLPAARGGVPAGAANEVLRVPAGGGSAVFGALDLSQAASITGTLPVARGGTGLTSLGSANRVLGVNAAATAAEYKAISGTTNQVTVTHGAGTITLATPQDLHAGATPTFAGVNATGAVVLPADPTSALQAATKQYVDARVGVPAGTILPFAGATAPTGFLACQGQSLLRADYPTLFATIGTSFGAADGTHFTLPDLRGRFLRGVDGGAGRDPDASTRTTCATGGASGDAIGSCQTDGFKSHTHQHVQYGQTVAFGPYGIPPQGNLSTPQYGTTSAAGGNETRPVNVSVGFIIKT